MGRKPKFVHPTPEQLKAASYYELDNLIAACTAEKNRRAHQWMTSDGDWKKQHPLKSAAPGVEDRFAELYRLGGFKTVSEFSKELGVSRQTATGYLTDPRKMSKYRLWHLFHCSSRYSEQHGPFPAGMTDSKNWNPPHTVFEYEEWLATGRLDLAITINLDVDAERERATALKPLEGEWLTCMYALPSDEDRQLVINYAKMLLMASQLKDGEVDMDAVRGTYDRAKLEAHSLLCPDENSFEFCCYAFGD